MAGLLACVILMLISWKVDEILSQVLEEIYRSNHSALSPVLTLALNLVHHQIF